MNNSSLIGAAKIAAYRLREAEGHLHLGEGLSALVSLSEAVAKIGALVASAQYPNPGPYFEGLQAARDVLKAQREPIAERAQILRHIAARTGASIPDLREVGDRLITEVDVDFELCGRVAAMLERTAAGADLSPDECRAVIDALPNIVVKLTYDVALCHKLASLERSLDKAGGVIEQARAIVNVADGVGLGLGAAPNGSHVVRHGR